LFPSILGAELMCVYNFWLAMCRPVIQRQNTKNMEQAFAAQILFSRGCIKAKMNELIKDAVSSLDIK